MNERVDSLENLQPLGDRLLVRRLPERRRGSVLLVTDERETSPRAVVVRVGPGLRDPEDRRARLPMECRVGDVVVFGRWFDVEERSKPDQLVIIQERDVRGIERRA